MEEKPFIESVQRHAANAFGISVIRNMGGGKGALSKVKKFLASVDLKNISKTHPQHFKSTLDRLTDELKGYSGLPWGAARKCLNIFFRDALYSHYLREAYGLKQFEQYFEVPLDGDVGKRLCKEPEGIDLRE